MGLASSCFATCKAEAFDLDSFEDALSTGDVCWLLRRGEEAKPFMLKYGFWRAFSHVGFLVRTGPGLEGLMLCIPKPPPELVQPGSADAAAVGQGAPVAFYPLSQEVHSSNARLAITSLNTRLPPATAQAVRNLAQASCARHMHARVPLHLTQTKKVFVTELVARMLEAAQLAACLGKPGGEQYFARGQLLLRPPRFVRLPKRRPHLPAGLCDDGKVFKESDSESCWSDDDSVHGGPVALQQLQDACDSSGADVRPAKRSLVHRSLSLKR